MRFDDQMPYFHLYGTDICLTAEEKGLNCYTIPAFCYHNTEQILTLPREFYICYKYMKRKWAKKIAYCDFLSKYYQIR